MSTTCPTQSQIELLRVHYLIALGRWTLLRDAEAAVRQAAAEAARSEVTEYLCEAVAAEIAAKADEAKVALREAAEDLEAGIELLRRYPASTRT